MTRSLFVYDDIFLEHDAGVGHPESQHRLIALMDHLDRRGTLSGLRRITPRAASLESLERVHEPAYIDGIRLMSAGTTADTVISPATYDCVLRASGGVQAAIDEVVAGRAVNAFCAHRPPGHHAEAGLAMGFCYVNHARCWIGMYTTATAPNTPSTTIPLSSTSAYTRPLTTPVRDRLLNAARGLAWALPLTCRCQPDAETRSIRVYLARCSGRRSRPSAPSSFFSQPDSTLTSPTHSEAW